MLLNEAALAYANGDLPLGLKLYFGHIVAEYDEASSAMQQAKYSALMKRPAWTLRWGISMAVRGEAVDPQPIGNEAAGNRGGGLRGGGFGDDYGDGYGEGMGGEGEGLYDDRGGRGVGGGLRGAGGPRGGGQPGMGGGQPGIGLLDDGGPRGGGRPGMGGGGRPGAMGGGYGEEGGMYGEGDGLYGDEDMYGDEMMMGGRGRGPRPGMGPGGAAGAAATPSMRLQAIERSMLSEAAQTELSENLGVVATAIADEMQKRYSDGQFGLALVDVAPGSGNRETVSSGFVDLLEGADIELPLWQPGIVYLGIADSDQNVTRARKAGVDLMIHIDVLLKPGREDFVQNISRARLIHVPSGKSLGVSKTMDSLDFTRESQRKGRTGREYVDEQLANFFSIIDRETATRNLPALTPEIARKRVGQILSGGGSRNLRSLAEVRLFQNQGLLTEEEVLTAFDIVGGTDAMQLIYASDDERIKIVHKWAGGKPDSQ